MNKKIDFFVIGAQKAGTSWLYQRLKELPDFTLPPVKQLHYFDRSNKYDSPNKLNVTKLTKRLMQPKWLIKAIGVTTLTLLKGNFKMSKWYVNWFFSNYSDDWYVSLFNQFEGITGEITPSYSILDIKDIEYMKQLAPDAKIIFILRNPIDRAWSHYRYDTRKVPGFDINNITTENIVNFINSEVQEQRSDYLNIIDKYNSVFGEKNVFVGFYDSISQEPISFLSDIVTFLGGNPDTIKEKCNIEQRINVSKKIELPVEIEKALQDKYASTINELSNKYDGYAKKWLHKISTK